MIDGAAGKVGELGARGGDAGLPFLIGIADDCVGVGDVKIIADQRDAERRIEVVQEDGSYSGSAIAFGVALVIGGVVMAVLATGKFLQIRRDIERNVVNFSPVLDVALAVIVAAGSVALAVYLVATS